MVVHVCYPSNWEAEGGGPQFQGQTELQSKSLPQKIDIYIDT
jgi:hypothetical protein